MSVQEKQKTFIEHLEELRKLLMQPFFVMAVVTGLAFWKHQVIITMLQKPLDKTLYYSSPMGGFTFIFQVAIVCGLLASLPFFVRGVIKFLEPITTKFTKRKLMLYLVSSVLLAIAGVAVGYKISLPAALHFLNGFNSQSLQPLISADQYLSFAMAYLAGFAVLFQMPLFIMIINHIKPLKPKKLMHYQKFVIAGSFIVAAVLTPTPDLVNQFIFAAPMIILYEISIALVFFSNLRPKKSKKKQEDELPHPIGAVYRPTLKQIVAEPLLLLEELADISPHPIGALYIPIKVEEYKEPRLRPIDVILSGYNSISI